MAEKASQHTGRVTLEEAFEYLNVTGDLLSSSSHRLIGSRSRRKGFKVGKPKVHSDKFIATVGLAFVGELSSTHLG